MLNHLQKYLEKHLQANAYAFSVLSQRLFSSVMTVLVLSVALSLPMLFWVIQDNLSSIAMSWQRNVHMTVYLKTAATPEEMSGVLQNIRLTEGVQQAVLKTPAEGLKEFQTQVGLENLMDYLSHNPLPAAIDITPRADYLSPVALKGLAKRLRSQTQVEQVRVDSEWIQRLSTLLSFLKHFIQAMLLLLVVAVLLTIGNTLRFIFNQKKDEMLVLKLVGATDNYVMRPFYYLGIWYGVFGALGAIFFSSLFFYYLGLMAKELLDIYQVSFSLKGLTLAEAYSFIGISGLLGFLAAQFFVRIKLMTIETDY